MKGERKETETRGREDYRLGLFKAHEILENFSFVLFMMLFCTMFFIIVLFYKWRYGALPELLMKAQEVIFFSFF